MTLREKQSLFAELSALLILQAIKFGYAVTLGEAWRSPQESARLARTGQGIKTSNHINRLAIDLNLFKDGLYLTTTRDYAQLGEWWEALHPLCRWGGKFSDGNHFSFEHNGRQ